MVERAKDVLRSAVRCLSTIHQVCHLPVCCVADVAISQVQGVEQCTKFTEFYMRVLKTALLAHMLKELSSGQ